MPEKKNRPRFLNFSEKKNIHPGKDDRKNSTPFKRRKKIQPDKTYYSPWKSNYSSAKKVQKLVAFSSQNYRLKK